MNLFLKINILLIIGLIILYLFFILFESINYDKKYKKIKEFEDSEAKSFIKNFFSNFFSDIKKFREINNKNILLDDNSLLKNENPDISIIITVYNQANCFYKALRSVQNQSIKNIEILIIDDCSIDNSTDVIEKYMKEDNRIILLKHESNEGKIKSRSDGILMARGKYITILDGDDMLSNESILFKCFTISILADLDIVEFNQFVYLKNKFYGLINYNMIKDFNNRIIYQPELYYKFVSFSKKDSDIGFLNRVIVSKLIKTIIFKKALEYIGPKYTKDYILDYEDSIMSVALFRVANSYYHMKEYGYYYAKEDCKNPLPNINFKKCNCKKFLTNNELDPIKYLNFLLDKYENKEIENWLLYKELISIDCIKHLDNYINGNFSYVYLIIEKINESNFNYKQRKDKILKIKEKLMKKEKLVQLNVNSLSNK